MRRKECYYIHNDKKYLVHIDYKSSRQRNNYYRLRDNTIFVIANDFTSEQSIINSLNTVIDKLASKVNKDYFTDEGVYILGELCSLKDGFFKFDGKNYLFGNKEMFYKKMKVIAKPYFESRVRYYSKIMHVQTNYKVSLKNVKTRYGSNSSCTKTLAFNIILIHFSPEIIDSVIVHELAHDFHRNHSSRFYDVVYRYCPNYDLLDKKLRKGVFKWLKKLRAKTTL